MKRGQRREEKKRSSSRQFSSSGSAAPRMDHEFLLWEAVMHVFSRPVVLLYLETGADPNKTLFLVGILLLGDPRG